MWIEEGGFKEDEITEDMIEDARKTYYYDLYGNDYTYRIYDENGDYTTVTDTAQLINDNKEQAAIDRGEDPDRKSGSSDAKEYDYKIIYKLTEYTPISGGKKSPLEKIPDLILNKKSLLILRNNDDKCFLYCYIREILNPITRNSFRITKEDKRLAKEIIDETNLTFDNVTIGEIDKIEKN